jgi:hypothetical protein
VSAALTLAGVRHASLRHTHGFVGSLLSQSSVRPRRTPGLRGPGRTDRGVYRETGPSVSAQFPSPRVIYAPRACYRPNGRHLQSCTHRVRGRCSWTRADLPSTTVPRLRLGGTTRFP